MQGCFNIRNCVKIPHHIYILKEKNHVTSSDCHVCSLAHIYEWLDDKRKVSWGSPGRNGLAVKVGPKVIEVRSEGPNISNLTAVWVSTIRQPITGLAMAPWDQGLLEHSVHSGRFIHTRLDSSTNLGNRDEFSASKNDKGSSMQNTRTLSPLGLSYNPQELNG